MKAILSLIISGALVVSGFGQTRNVLVGTNNAVVQPTNFWSADASNARTGLGLGTAATNNASVFQPASLALTNLSANNGGGLTNLTASNVIGTLSLNQGGTGATNATGARTALQLGTAATNPASAFQPASSTLSNLVSGGALTFTNITVGISNVTGLQTSLDGKLATSGTATLATNVTGVVALVNGGTGATNASGARTALELGTAATNSANAFQPSSSVLTNLAANNGGSLTNITAANVVGTVGLASNITGTAPLATNVTGVVALANGGTAGTNAASARTSLGATTIGANLFTLVNPDDTRFVRLNANNSVSALSAADMRTALSVGTNVGTVTSVGMTVPNIFSLSTPTITSSGTFGLTLANQSSRQAFLVPNGGGIPAFRALESDDLPSLAISKVTGLQTALDGKLATSGTATLATNVTGVVAVANGGTGGTSAETGRTGLGATTVGSAVFTLANPSAVRFLRYNADNTVSALSDSDFRTAIGLGTASTNASSAFQPSSSSLTNLAANNAINLTNLQATNLVGTIPSSNIATVNFSNVAGTLSVASGGTGATNAAGARTSLGLDSAATNPASAFQPSSTVLSNLASSNGASLTNIPIAGVVGALATNGSAANLTNFPASLLTTNGNGFGLTNLNASNITGQIPASNISSVNFSNLSGTLVVASGGTGATNAAAARTNLGLGATWLTSSISPIIPNSNGYVVSPFVVYDSVNTNEMIRFPSDADNTTDPVVLGVGWDNSNVRTKLGLGQSNSPRFAAIILQEDAQALSNSIVAGQQDIDFRVTNISKVAIGATRVGFTVPIDLSTNSRATTRTNLGLGWAALTNTSTDGFNTSLYGSGTNPVLYNTNGSVVSPTNFWQVAPIQTVVQSSVPATNSTNAATNSRNLYLYSLGTNIVNVTNTITLPTNTSTLAGDNATIIHQGPTSSVTAIRQLGQTNNLITINKYDEAVKFIYENGAWTPYHNISFVEPIVFSGTNATANAAASRTNLGLGLSALTNTSNAGFRTAIELGETNNVSFSNVTASGTLTATSTVTAKTNLVVGGHLDFTTNATNSNPATNNQIQDFIEIRVGTNQYWLPIYK